MRMQACGWITKPRSWICDHRDIAGALGEMRERDCGFEVGEGEFGR